MCRLLFLLDTTHKKNKILSFLAQSNNDKNNNIKTLPTVSPEFNVSVTSATSLRLQNHLDGFGLSWLDKNKKWNLYKKPFVYTEDKFIEKKIDSFDSNIIIGHIRNKTLSSPQLRNTHPFIYKNQIFCHNGCIENFLKNKSIIFEKINIKYKKCIKGETDSEYLFYFLLSCKDNICRRGGVADNSETLNSGDTVERVCTKRTNNNNDEEITENELLLDSFTFFFETLQKMNIFITANIIFSTNNSCVISRFIINPKSNDESLLLYYDNTDGLIITTEPITPNYHLIAENSIIIINL